MIDYRSQKLGPTISLLCGDLVVLECVCINEPMGWDDSVAMTDIDHQKGGLII